RRRFVSRLHSLSRVVAGRSVSRGRSSLTVAVVGTSFPLPLIWPRAEPAFRPGQASRAKRTLRGFHGGFWLGGWGNKREAKEGLIRHGEQAGFACQEKTIFFCEDTGGSPEAGGTHRRAVHPPGCCLLDPRLRAVQAAACRARSRAAGPAPAPTQRF